MCVLVYSWIGKSLDVRLRLNASRKNLSNSLSDLDSIIHAIDLFLYNVQGVLLFLVSLVVFSTGELADVTLTAGLLECHPTE